VKSVKESLAGVQTLVWQLVQDRGRIQTTPTPTAKAVVKRLRPKYPRLVVVKMSRCIWIIRKISHKN